MKKKKKQRREDDEDEKCIFWGRVGELNVERCITGCNLAGGGCRRMEENMC